MELNLDNIKIILNFSWVPLRKDGRNVYLWDLGERKSGEDQPVIYRFVLMDAKAGKITVYVGEGRSLNGPQKNNLAHQWKQTPGQTRQRVKDYVQQQSKLYMVGLKSFYQPSLILNYPMKEKGNFLRDF